jgi:hypothetical protein
MRHLALSSRGLQRNLNMMNGARTIRAIARGFANNEGQKMEQPDKAIMIRELLAAYPNNTSFHKHVWNFAEDLCLLKQVYQTICIDGGELVETVEQWNAIPEKMGWKSR